MNQVGEGWIYYSFTNPATGRDEPKASYLKSIDWDGALATIGAGDLSPRPTRNVQK